MTLADTYLSKEQVQRSLRDMLWAYAAMILLSVLVMIFRLDFWVEMAMLLPLAAAAIVYGLFFFSFSRAENRRLYRAVPVWLVIKVYFIGLLLSVPITLKFDFSSHGQFLFMFASAYFIAGVLSLRDIDAAVARVNADA